jgi:SAM-dependent methyltransferase
LSQPPEFETPPAWLRPRGVAAGTWQYVHQRSIADRYDAFVADTPLCQLDSAYLEELFPGLAGDSQTEHPQTVMDLGCGSGRTAIPLAERGYRVLAVDLSQRMLEVMQEKQHTFRSGAILPLRANIVELDCLADDSVDHVVCLFSTLGMIQGRANRRAVMSHAARIVRDGGSFLLHVHNRWSALREPHGIQYLLRSWWQSVRQRDVDFGDATYAYRGLEAMFMHRFSRRELLQDLQHTGWTIQQVWNVSIDGASTSRNMAIAGGFLVHCKRGSAGRR